MSGFIIPEQTVEKPTVRKYPTVDIETEDVVVVNTDEPILEKPVVAKNATVEVPIATEAVNIDKLAYAVAMAETHNCTKGYGAMYNNCFGIKNGNTAPCKKIGNNRMCIYDTPEESYDAFKKIWNKWYVTFPNRQLSSKWTGADRVDTWLEHVTHYYYN